jgi:hypothetical protein
MPVTDPNALAAIVSNLGGTVAEARTFQFDLPLGKVRDVVPTKRKCRRRRQAWWT